MAIDIKLQCKMTEEYQETSLALACCDEVVMRSCEALMVRKSVTIDIT